MTRFGNVTLALILLATTAAQAQTNAAPTQPRDTTGAGQTKPPSRNASPPSRVDTNTRTRNDWNRISSPRASASLQPKVAA